MRAAGLQWPAKQPNSLTDRRPAHALQCVSDEQRSRHQQLLVHRVSLMLAMHAEGSTRGMLTNVGSKGCIVCLS